MKNLNRHFTKEIIQVIHTLWKRWPVSLVHIHWTRTKDEIDQLSTRLSHALNKHSWRKVKRWNTLDSHIMCPEKVESMRPLWPSNSTLRHMPSRRAHTWVSGLHRSAFCTSKQLHWPDSQRKHWPDYTICSHRVENKYRNGGVYMLRDALPQWK